MNIELISNTSICTPYVQYLNLSSYLQGPKTLTLICYEACGV